MKRRDFVRVVGAAAIGGTGLRGALAQGLPAAQDLTPLIRKLTGGRVPEPRDVDIEIPTLAENGNSVTTRIRVANPMTEADHVKTLYVLAERNPRPHVATFHLGPQSGKAEIATRIRLAGTQKVTVLAALSGERYRIGRAEVIVTAAACIDETAG